MVQTHDDPSVSWPGYRGRRISGSRLGLPGFIGKSHLMLVIMLHYTALHSTTLHYTNHHYTSLQYSPREAL